MVVYICTDPKHASCCISLCRKCTACVADGCDLTLLTERYIDKPVESFTMADYAELVEEFSNE